MHLRGTLMLLAASFFWGTTFVAQILGMEGLGPYTYAASRFALGTLLIGTLWYAYRGKRAAERRAGTFHSGFRAGIPVGLAMFVGVTLQQVALLYTTAGKTAFITTLYIVLVPLAPLPPGKRCTRCTVGRCSARLCRGLLSLCAWGAHTQHGGHPRLSLFLFLDGADSPH